MIFVFLSLFIAFGTPMPHQDLHCLECAAPHCANLCRATEPPSPCHLLASIWVLLLGKVPERLIKSFPQARPQTPQPCHSGTSPQQLPPLLRRTNSAFAHPNLCCRAPKVWSLHRPPSQGSWSKPSYMVSCPSHWEGHKETWKTYKYKWNSSLNWEASWGNRIGPCHPLASKGPRQGGKQASSDWAASLSHAIRFAESEVPPKRGQRDRD